MKIETRHKIQRLANIATYEPETLDINDSRHPGFVGWDYQLPNGTTDIWHEYTDDEIAKARGDLHNIYRDGSNEERSFITKVADFGLFEGFSADYPIASTAIKASMVGVGIAGFLTVGYFLLESN